MLRRFFQAIGLTNKTVTAWTMYDWANSAFATTVMVVILPIYFADVAAANLPQNLRTAYWGYASAFSILCVALISPFLGTLADIIPWKKKLLAVFMLMGAGSCLGLYFVESGDWLLATILYFIGTLGFAAGNVFYESLLPHICSSDEIDRVSSAGYAIGYIGGGTLLAINLIWISSPELFGMASKQDAVRYSLASVGVWWLIFSLPLFMYVPEPPRSSTRQGSPSSSARENLRKTFIQLKNTLLNLRNYRYVVLFLAAFYFFSDGIGTVMKMSTIYGRELGIPQSQLIGAMLLVQFLGVPCTFLFGPLSNWLGIKQSITLCLGVYMVVCIVGFAMKDAWQFWMLAAMVATVQGGCQALSRSLFASIIPRSKSAEFFGFYSVSSRFAGVLGPFLFGFLANHLGHSRYSLLFVITFFAIGGVILSRLNLEQARSVVKEEN